MCEFVKGKYVFPGYGCCYCKAYNGLQRRQCKACNTDHCELTIPDDMSVGEYHEEGGITLVSILAVNFDEQGYSYKLKVIRTIQPSPMCGEITTGSEFSPWVSYEAGGYAGGWHLV